MVRPAEDAAFVVECLADMPGAILPVTPRRTAGSAMGQIHPSADDGHHRYGPEPGQRMPPTAPILLLTYRLLPHPGIRGGGTIPCRHAVWGLRSSTLRLTHSFQRRAPRNQLVQQGLEILLVLGSLRFERTVVLEICGQ